jgi:hypothetical protein
VYQWVAFARPNDKGGRCFGFCFEFVTVLNGTDEIQHFKYWKLSNKKGKLKLEFLNKFSLKMTEINPYFGIKDH